MDSKTFMRHFQIPSYKPPMFLHQAAKKMRQDILALQPFPGITNVLSALHTAGHQLSVVSSNSEHNIQTWLCHQGLEAYFSVIAHAPKYLGKAKILKRVIKQSSHTKNRVYYIGDETRDIKAARQAGVAAIAVT